MTKTISIRKLGPEDGGIYRALMLRGYSEHDTAFTSTFEERAGKPADWWAKRLSDPTAVTLGAFDGTTMIGTVRIERYQRARELHKVHLTAMYVISDMVGQGIGRQLVQAILVEARAIRGVEIIGLSVTAENLPALRLYGTCGFQSYGREVRAVRLPAGGYLDKVYMWRPVSADYVSSL